jgi:membrane associated rhomboid family serine protease
VHAVHLLVAALVVSMLVTTALQFARADGLIALLSFSGEAVWRGEVWRVLTYGLVNPPSLGLAIELLMLVWFGREVEGFLGRRDFLRLYVGLYLVRPLLFSALAPVLPANFAGGTGSFAVFIAFATLFPDAPLLFNLLARWVAWGLLALGALMALGARDGMRLLELAATSGFAFAFIRHHQGRWSFPRFPRFRLSRPAPATATRAAPVPVAARAGTARSSGTTPPVAAPMAEVDALLDKIAQSGIHSLTAAERARLEAAREDLQRRRPKG